MTFPPDKGYKENFDKGSQFNKLHQIDLISSYPTALLRFQGILRFQCLNGYWNDDEVNGCGPVFIPQTLQRVPVNDQFVFMTVFRSSRDPKTGQTSLI